MSETPIPDDPDTEEEIPVDPRVTPVLFREWRSPRFGMANPERMNNPVWEWLVRSELSAYHANERLDGPKAMDAGPGWCFMRYGQSATPLADGRTVLIAGEHEDYYDPDFQIYNDVVVLHPDGRVDIFGYPPEVFPATDFHTATLIENQIVIVGNLSYPKDRRPGTTPVFSLDLDTFAISRVQPAGTPPGWIHAHETSLSEDGASLIVRRGLLDLGDPAPSLVENIDDWGLRLTDWTWQRLTDRQWPRFEVAREDRGRNHLFEIDQAVWARDFPEFNRRDASERSVQRPTLKEELGAEPDLDLFARLYSPEFPHEEIPESDEEFRVHRITVAGVTVRYVEDGYSIRVTVEGELPPDRVDALAEDLRGKLSALENAACLVRKI